MPNEIPAVLEKTDFEALAEPVRDYFTEKDGKFYPNFSPSNVEKLAVGLRQNRDTILQEKRTLEEAFKPYKELGTPEEIQAKIKAAESGQSEDVQKIKDSHRTEIENLRNTFKTESEKSVNGFKQREQGLLTSVEKLLKTSAVTSAIAEHQGVEKLLAPAIVSSLKVVESKNDDDSSRFDIHVLDKEGKTRYADALGTLFTVSDLVKEMRADKDFAGAFVAGTAGGAGFTNQQRGGFGGNTVRVSRAESKNNPQLYQQAKAQAEKQAVKSSG